jgi:DNA-binding response OmpR family regulator
MTKNQLLLLVEDEALIQNLLRNALLKAGYEVVVAGNGVKALEELALDTNRFRGVITDIRLGSGPNGWAVAHRARALSPTIPVIYMSGDSGHEWSSQGVPNSVMLVKPFRMSEVVAAVSALILAEDTRQAASP